jgi:transglutaminase-like putative cysteine protease
MAYAPGTPARTQRLIAVAATALLGVTTAMAIGRVFVGAATSYRMIAAALASAAIACAMERRNLLLATLVSAVGLLVVVGLLIFPGSTWHGLPTMDTLHAIADASKLVGQEARRQVAPTAPLAPLVLAALTATWAAVFSAHALAFRAGSPLLALLPPIALVAFADTVLEEFIRPVYGLLFLGAALLVVFADGLRRLQGWGPVWTGPGRQARLSTTAGRSARGVAFAAMGLALIAPILLPGFGSKAVLDFSSANGDSVGVNPLVSVANDLQQQEERDVFTVHTSSPSYYRLVALPNFNGVQWSQDPNPVLTSLPDDPSVATPLLSPEVIALTPDPVQESFELRSDLNQGWLPVGYPPQSVQLDADTTWDAESGSVGIEGLDQGTRYTVTSLQLQPTPAQLRATDAPTPAQVQSYITVDPSVDPTVANIADHLTADAATEYDKVIAVQDYLRDSGTFEYDTTVPKRDDSGALLDFLTVSQVGFCQQFAAAMAVLLREEGIPARVAVGFTSGTQSADDPESWTITSHDAHAWVEVLFSGYGWLPFEPTPQRVNPVASVYTSPVTSPTCTAKNCPGGPGGTHGKGDENPVTPAVIPAERNTRGGGGGALPTSTVAPADHISAKRLLLIAGALTLLGLLLLPLARTVRRRRRLAHASGRPRELILATYDVFAERAAELGFARSEGETIEEYRRRVSASGLLRDGDLDRLSTITTGAAYAPREPHEDDARAAAEAAHTTLKELQRGTPWTARIRGRYRWYR